VDIYIEYLSLPLPDLVRSAASAERPSVGVGDRTRRHSELDEAVRREGPRPNAEFGLDLRDGVRRFKQERAAIGYRAPEPSGHFARLMARPLPVGSRPFIGPYL
jgi:hypothetical protein